ncbi:MAG TPA: antibiotic biosynthesis monooxygenase [Bacillota bacterium]|nr:antibiotic biosynthesis monooxygenase [Bacillota bacterium]
MKGHMTNGTIMFLKKLAEKYKNLDLFLMTGSQGALAYYEHDKKRSIFQAGRSYEIIAESGHLRNAGYVVMNHIPVAEDSKPVFEDNFKKRRQEVDQMPGFLAFRLLRPLKGNTYIVMTQWATETDFENWKKSSAFQKAHDKQAVKQPAYFAERPFATAYWMYKEKENREL